MKRISLILSWAFLLACLISYAFTSSTAWILGYGREARAALVALHSGRAAFIYHVPSVLKPGLIAQTERAAPSARNYLLPYRTTSRRSIVSIPLYIPMIFAASLLAWQRQRHQGQRIGFALVMASLAGPSKRD